MKRIAAIVLLLGSLASAQLTVYTYNAEIRTHGGRRTFFDISANKGDLMTLYASCDHPWLGQCLYGSPMLDDGTLFELIEAPSDIRQVYQLKAPHLGDQIINLDYWWVGTDVHYRFHVRNKEILTDDSDVPEGAQMVAR